MKYLPLILILLFATPSEATTYYVRTDGGTYTQCLGTTDAAYDGSGTGEACAWSHPSVALGVNSSCRATDGIAHIVGGDTVIIKNGSYAVGCGMPGAKTCAQMTSSSSQCSMLTVPDGNVGNPTKIYGEGWDTGCSTKAELYGKEKVYYVMNLQSTDYADLRCLEITDHDSCMSHSYAINNCDGTYPYGDWAQNGIGAHYSTNIILRDIYIHGVASHGFYGSNLGDYDVSYMDIKFNQWSWDGDNTSVEDDSYTGTIKLDHVNFEYNGCSENYPADGLPRYCGSQGQGISSSDGIGLGNGEPGNWEITNSNISHNTADGPDLLHGDGNTGYVYVSRSKFEGNAGQQFKNGYGTKTVVMENSKFIGNCDYFNGQTFTMTRSQDDRRIASKSSCAGGTVGSEVFTGSGLNDAVSGGSYSGDLTINPTWTVQIDSVGTPDTFKWKKDSGAYTTGVPVSTTATELGTGEGATIRWLATTGHTLNDQWVFTVFGCGFDQCRAFGNTVTANLGDGSTIDIRNSTIFSIGDVVMELGGTACTATSKWTIDNSIITGYNQWNGAGDRPDFFYVDNYACSIVVPDTDNSVIYYVRDTAIPCADASNKCQTPYFTVGSNLPTAYKGSDLDVSLASNSPARELADETITLWNGSNDMVNTPRGADWDSGALEYAAATCTTDCTLCSNETDCEESAEVCYWWSDLTCHTTEEPPEPDCSDDCALCADETECEADGDLTCYWWNSACSPNQSCDQSCTLCNNETDCGISEQTCYWWSDFTCNSTEEVIPDTCNTKCSLCLLEATCELSTYPCFWWSTNECREEEEPSPVPSCTDTCGLCTTENDCEAAGGITCYWWSDSTCSPTEEDLPDWTCDEECSVCEESNSPEDLCEDSNEDCYWWSTLGECRNYPDRKFYLKAGTFYGLN